MRARPLEVCPIRGVPFRDTRASGLPTCPPSTCLCAIALPDRAAASARRWRLGADLVIDNATDLARSTSASPSSYEARHCGRFFQGMARSPYSVFLHTYPRGKAPRRTSPFFTTGPPRGVQIAGANLVIVRTLRWHIVKLRSSKRRGDNRAVHSASSATTTTQAATSFGVSAETCAPWIYRVVRNPSGGPFSDLNLPHASRAGSGVRTQDPCAASVPLCAS